MSAPVCIPFALQGEVDATAWASTTVIKFGATSVTTASTELFDSPIGFLSGYGMFTATDLGTDLTTVGTGLGTWAIGLTPETGRFYVTNDTETFDLTVLGADAANYGFGANGTTISSSLSGGLNRVDAPYDPVAGVVEHAHLTLNPSGGAAFQVPSRPFRAQSITTLLRTMAGSDADQNYDTTNLGYLANTALAKKSVTFGVTEEGRTWIAYDDGDGITAPVWQVAGATLMGRLGFRGDETSSTSVGDVGTLRYFESAEFCQYALCTTRPYQEVRPGQIEVTHAQRNTDAEFVSNVVASWRRLEVDFFIDGPHDSRDLQAHAQRFFELMPLGSRIDVMLRGIGEPRRALRRLEQVYEPVGGTWTVPPYSELYTSADNGLGGRWLGRRSDVDEAEKMLDPPGGPVRRIPMTIIVDRAESTA